MSSTNQNKKTNIKQRLKEEMYIYIIISLYIWICLSTILIYEVSINNAKNANMFLPISAALVKAIILGKFILIGKSLKIGSKINSSILLNKIILKSIAMLLVLMVLKSIEELVVGLSHGLSVPEIINEFLNHTLIQNIAPSAVMLLVLIPIIAFEEIDNVLGKGKLKHMLFNKNED